MVDEGGADRARLPFVQRFRDMLADGTGVGRDALAVFTIDAGDLQQHRAKPGTAVVIVLGWKVRAAEKDFALWGQERGEGPAALSGEGLHGALVARVHVGALIAVHLHTDEFTIQDCRDARVFVRLAIHHVAPVAPHRADVEQHRLVLGARPRERCVAPGKPVHGLMGGGLQVSRWFGGELV